MTTTVNGDLIYGATVTSTGTSTIAAETGFTQAQSIANAYMTEYRIQAIASATTPATFTNGSTDSFNTTAMAFKHR